MNSMVALVERLNPKLEVTGMMAFYMRSQTDFKCVHYIEGPEAKVDRIVNAVKRDPRIKEVRVLMTHALPNRLFPEFSMRFLNLSELRAMIRRFHKVFKQLFIQDIFSALRKDLTGRELSLH